MTLAAAASELVSNIVELPAKFAEVAFHDPLNPFLMLVSVLFLAGSVGVLGYLTLGAVTELFTGGPSSGPPPEAR
ncbi:hypothetical protein BRD17_05725 [Halobacteriales archaeon SW_7_68_16]|nr:MAG: hypothetical protein BRD17_05725 [Halobacteriales archaeon SW_7_68_16]